MTFSCPRVSIPRWRKIRSSRRELFAFHVSVCRFPGGEEEKGKKQEEGEDPYCFGGLIRRWKGKLKGAILAFFSVDWFEEEEKGEEEEKETVDIKVNQESDGGHRHMALGDNEHHVQY